MDAPNKKPGDYLLDKYFPDADKETRESARGAFRDFASFLLRMGDRLEADGYGDSDSTNPDTGATISKAPKPPP